MIFLILGGAAVLLPYLILPVIPGIDYPNHLARLAILGAAPGSAIRGNYAPHWALMPDLGLDLAYMALRPFASPDAVMRLCLVGALATMLACAGAIQRHLFRTSSMSLALMPLCCAGLPVVMGYVNFVMSCGFVMLGIWLSLAWRMHLVVPRLLALAAIGAAAWLCHFAGYAMLMVFIACLLLHDTLLAGAPFFQPGGTAMRLARAGARMLLVALPGLALSVFAERRADTGGIAYGFLKIRVLLAPVIATDTPFDYALWAGFCAALLVILWFCRWRVAPPARLGLIVLFALAAVLPTHIGSAVDVDSRLAPPIMLSLLAASRIELPPGLWTGRLLMGFLALLIIGRDVAVAALGMGEARTVGVFRAAERLLPAGSAMMVATDPWHLANCQRGGPASLMSPFVHMAAYATIDGGIWEPYIFAGQGMQPVRSVRAGFPASPAAVLPPSLDAVEQSLRAGGMARGSAEPERMPPGWPERFSSLLVLGSLCHANPLPGLLTPLAEGPDFTLFAIAPAAKK